MRPGYEPSAKQLLWKYELDEIESNPGEVEVFNRAWNEALKRAQTS